MNSEELATQRHVLYRFFDASDHLLYIGITNNPSRRFGQHSDRKPWWTDVATIRMEAHPNRAAVLDAERRAIAAEAPLHNVRLQGADVHATRDTASSAGEWPVAVGDVVALALHRDGDTDQRMCPIGRVEAVGPWGARLALLSFVSGLFDQQRAVSWDRVAEIRWAYPMSRSKKERQGYLRDQEVFDCDEIGEFQTLWVHGREQLQADRLRQEQRERRQIAETLETLFPSRSVDSAGVS